MGSGMEAARRVLEHPTPTDASSAAALPSGFYDAFVLRGIRVEAAEPGRLLCRFTVPSRLLVVIFSFLFFLLGQN